MLLTIFPMPALIKNPTWSRGVTVSILDSESSDRGSNPREAFWFHIELFDEWAMFAIENRNLLSKWAQTTGIARSMP